MLIKNLEQRVLVNGSQGRVTRFMNAKDAHESNIKLGIFGDVTKKGSQAAAQLEQLIKEGKVWPLVMFTNGREVREFRNYGWTINLTFFRDAISSY